PTDANTTYHTTTVLTQRPPQLAGKAGDVPGNQGVPAQQRPPQFDYIYRANRDAQAQATKDATALGKKVDSLQKRLAQLEEEQSALWCEIAFRAVGRLDLPRKPMYRFDLISATTDAADRERADVAKEAAAFVRTGLSVVSQAEKSQANAFGGI